MYMPKKVRVIHLIIVVSVSILITFSATALGGSYTSPAEYLQVEHGYTELQARQRIQAEDAAALARLKAIEVTGDAFAGSWFSPDHNALVVAVTDSQEFDVLERLGVIPVVHEFSIDRLERERSKIDVKAKISGVANLDVQAWYIDVISNSLVVEHRPGQRAQAQIFVVESGVSGVPVEFRESVEQSVLAYDVEGGDKFYNADNGNVPCTIGFSITGGYLTAGHCGDYPDDVDGYNGVSQGYYAASGWPYTDRAWVNTNESWAPKAQVNGYSHGTLYITGDLAGFKRSPVNSTVCRYGITTSARCGTVKAHNVSHPFGITVRLFGLTRTTACIDLGDSGGPFLSSSGYYAQGTTVGGEAGTCPNPAKHSYYEPAKGATSEYSKTLLTQHGASSPTTKDFVCPDPGLGGGGTFFCSAGYDSQGSTSTTWTASTGDSSNGTITFVGTCSPGTTVYVNLDVTNPYGTDSTSTSFSCP